MVMQVDGIIKDLEEFVVGGYRNEDAYVTSKLYQKVQTNLYKLADKLNACGNDDNAQEIIELSESLKEIYNNVNIKNMDCRKE